LEGPSDPPTPPTVEVEPDWLRRARRSVTRQIGQSGAGWVVAVSGGGDSVALIRALHGFAAGVGLRLSVAHLDHGARGEESAADARFVAELAGALGLPCDLGRWSPARPAHFEADARRARLAWLAGVAARRGASVVATGHTRDDQAETILHRILRGTGPSGLAGMPARRLLADSVRLVRPLLGSTRRELRAYLVAMGQPFRDDPTNLDTSRTRARLRHDLLPKLAAEYNPRVAEALVRLGRLAAAANRENGAPLRALERAATLAEDDAGITLDRAFLARLARPLRAEVLRLAWRRRGWPEVDMDATRWRRLALVAAGGGGRCAVGGGIDAWGSGSTLRLATAGARTASPILARSLPIPGMASWGDGQLVASLDADPQCESESESESGEVIDLDRLAPPLYVRSPAPGDRLDPLGMDGRTRPLNDLFRGRGVAKGDRARVPLVCDGLGIVWVVGHRIAHRVRRTADTRRTLGLRWEAT